MWRTILKNRVMRSGIGVLALGLSTTILGYAAFVNHSVTCLVVPAFNPCITSYQVALLAPLYPLSMELVATGLLLGLIGAMLIAVGFSKGKRIESQPQIIHSGQVSDASETISATAALNPRLQEE